MNQLLAKLASSSVKTIDNWRKTKPALVEILEKHLEESNAKEPSIEMLWSEFKSLKENIDSYNKTEKELTAIQNRVELLQDLLEELLIEIERIPLHDN